VATSDGATADSGAAPSSNRDDNETDRNKILSAFLKYGKFLYGKELELLFETDLKRSRPAK
jgi:hypothetical protein